VTPVVHHGAATRTARMTAVARAWERQAPLITVTPYRRGWVAIRLDLGPAALDIRGRGRYHAEHLRNRWVQRGWTKAKSLSVVGPTMIEVVAREDRAERIVVSLVQYTESTAYFRAL